MRWMRRLWRWLRPRATRFGVVLVDDLPDHLKPQRIYLVGEGTHQWCAALLCPCGCGDVIRLNLLQDARPCWKVREDPDGAVSLEPSVWRQKGCQRHFIVRRGSIEWCSVR